MATTTPLRILTSALNARLSAPQVASTVARLVADESAVCAADICRVTGLARSTVASSIGALVRGGVLRYDGIRETIGRGRPAERLIIDSDFAVIGVIEIEPGSARVTVHDLSQRQVAAKLVTFDLQEPPESVLDRCANAVFDLLESTPKASANLCVVLSIAASIDVDRGTVARAHGLPSWNALPVVDLLSTALGCPVILESEANLAAVGESRAVESVHLPLVLISVSHGISCGIIDTAGSIFRGASGAAGDIAHLKRQHDQGDVRCYCGRTGCLDSVASGAALARQFDESSGDVDLLRALTDALRRLESRALDLVGAAGWRIGDAVIDLVQFLNPATIIIAGRVGSASDHLVTAVRERVFQHASGLAVRHLAIEPPRLGLNAARAGAVVAGIEHLLGADALHEALIPTSAFGESVVNFAMEVNA